MASYPPASLQPVDEGTAQAGRRETVALVFPLYDEADMLSVLIEQVEAFRAKHPEVVQVILVDDGSTDATWERVRMLTKDLSGYVVLRFSRNFGHQIAITAGLDLVQADAAVVLDADLQDPLPVVTQMIAKWREGYDVVYGIRRRREGETVFKRATAAAFYRLFQWMADLDMPADAGDFRLISRPVLAAYRQIGEQQPFVRGLIAWLGFNQVGIEYERAPRAAGETKYPFRKMLRLATRSLTSFSDKPLRFAVRIGLSASFIAVAGLIWVLLDKLVWGTPVLGWASILFAVFFFGGLQLFFLGIVGAYLARVYDEVKARPRYVVQEAWTSTGTVLPDGNAMQIADGRPLTAAHPQKARE